MTRKPSIECNLKALVGLDRRIDNGRFLLAHKENERSILVKEIQSQMGRKEVRTKFINFDARREPQSEKWCVCCQRDIREKGPVKGVHLAMINGAPQSVHPDDVPLFHLGILELPAGSDYLGVRPMGARCVKKHGLEWAVVYSE